MLDKDSVQINESPFVEEELGQSTSPFIEEELGQGTSIQYE